LRGWTGWSDRDISRLETTAMTDTPATPPRGGQPPGDHETDTSDIGAIDASAFRTVDGAYSDEVADPAFQPVIEAGGGVAEGFEQAEALLVEHALDDDLAALKRVSRHAGQPEDPDPGVYGEADQERTSERHD
jgi:hypothetical protein